MTAPASPAPPDKTRPGRGKFLAALASLLVLLACGKVALKGAKEASTYKTLERAVPEIRTPDGFRAVVVAEGFNYPSAMTWDRQGRLFVLESRTVPIPTLEPGIVRVDAGGHLEKLPVEGEDAPTGKQAVGLTFHDGWLYWSHEQKDGTWGITRVRPEGGHAEAVVRGIPTRGDHWVNYLAFDRSGALWFGAGSATNSGVVSSHDPVDLKWIKDRPDARDVPCRDLALTAETFRETSGIAPDKGAATATGAFQPYRHAGVRRIAGSDPCTSAVYRLAPGSKKADVAAWGFRNPVGIAIDGNDRVYIGMQGADVRGTRPVRDDPDAVYRLRSGAWYGWPDYSAALLPIDDARYGTPTSGGGAGPRLVIDGRSSGLPAPDRSLLVAATSPHAAICGMAVVPPRGPFARWAGKILVSEMGDFRPLTDAEHPGRHSGFQVEIADPASGGLAPFVRNANPGDALPATAIPGSHGLERPVDVGFGPDGNVYILDFGVFVPTDKAGKIFPKTGRVFRIEPSA